MGQVFMQICKILWQCLGGWLWNLGHPLFLFFFLLSLSQFLFQDWLLLASITSQNAGKFLGRRGVRSMIYLQGNEVFWKFGSTHLSWRQDALLAGTTLLSFTRVLLLHLYFCWFQKKERFNLPSQKQIERSIWRVSLVWSITWTTTLHHSPDEGLQNHRV